MSEDAELKSGGTFNIKADSVMCKMLSAMKNKTHGDSVDAITLLKDFGVWCSKRNLDSIKKLQKDNTALEEEVVMLQGKMQKGNMLTYKIWRRFSHTRLVRAVEDLRVEKQKLKTDLDYHMGLLKDCDKLLHEKRLKLSATEAENKVLRGTVPEGHAVIVIGKLKSDLAKLRWIPVGEGLPKLTEKDTQSVWVRVTDGIKVVDAYYYDYTKRKTEPNCTIGKGWNAHGIRKSEITHYQYIILP